MEDQNPFLSTAQPQQDRNPFINTPDDVTNALADTGDTKYAGLCEAWAEKQAGLPQMGGSAREAWDNWNQQGKASTDWQNAPEGSLIYFNDPGQPFGHVGIVTKPGEMSSSTYNGVETTNINDWVKTANQTPLGYVMP